MATTPAILAQCILGQTELGAFGDNPVASVTTPVSVVTISTVYTTVLVITLVNVVGDPVVTAAVVIVMPSLFTVVTVYVVI